MNRKKTQSLVALALIALTLISLLSPGVASADSTYTYDPNKALAQADSLLRNTPTSGGRGASYVSSVLRAGGLSNVKKNGAGDLIEYLKNTKNFGGKSIGKVITNPKYTDLEIGDVLACVCIQGSNASDYTNGHSKGAGKYYGIQVMFVSAVGNDYVKVYAATDHKYNERITLSCNGGSYICKCSKCNSTKNVKWIAFCFSDSIKNRNKAGGSGSSESSQKVTIKNPKTIAAGYHHTVAVKNNGTVVACGSNDSGQCNVGSWKNIVSVAAGRSHTVGLKKDGTVVACGSNDYGQCDVSGWSNIVAIAAGRGFTVGLKSDGSVVAKGKNDYGQCNVSGWRNIKAIAVGESHTVGLKTDGTVVAVGYSNDNTLRVSDWTNIVGIAANKYQTVGLKSDGTVVSTWASAVSGDYSANWKSIKAVSAGGYYIVGLKADGSVKGTGVEAGMSWRMEDITVGWENMVAISVGDSHVVGLTKNGKVIAGGRDYDHVGLLNVSGWSDIRVP